MPTDRNLRVSLGCGTLVLIALIMYVVANLAQNDLGNEIQQLETRIIHLESRMKAHTEAIEDLEESIDALRKELRQAPQKPLEEPESTSPSAQAI